MDIANNDQACRAEEGASYGPRMRFARSLLREALLGCTIYAHQRNQVSCHHSSDKPADYSCFLTLLSAPFCPCTPHCFPPLQPCIESRWHQCNI